MKQGKKLLILPAVAVLLGMGTGCSDNSENKAQDMARKALMASTTSTRPFSRQKAEIMSISYRTPVEVSCIFTRKPV